MAKVVPFRRVQGGGSARRQSGSDRKIRYAVVGLGYITQVAVLPAFQHAEENSELAALVSSDPKKLKELSREYAVSRTYSYEQYEDCLNSGDIDAVYLALPNSMHRDFTERAARAGLHVLCEKPMAVTVGDCVAMIEAAREHNVKLMVAYRLHFEEANLSAIELVKSGRMGDVRIFNSVFTQDVKQGNIRLEGELGGGPLLDMGIYCINAARYLFQAEPLEAIGFTATRRDARFKEVEETDSAILRFPGDRLASFTCSFGAADTSEFELVGTKGKLRMNPAYEYAQPLKWELTIGAKAETREFEKRDQFAPELIYFSHCITDDEEPEPSGEEGLADMIAIHAIYESARSGKSVSVGHFDRTTRPSRRQEIKKPAVKKPKMINAESPSGT